MVDSPDGSVFNEVAIQSELADERIDLPQAQRQLRIAFQVAAHEAVFARARFQRHGASVIGGSDAVLLGQRQHTQDAAHRNWSLALVQGLAQRADVRSGLVRAAQQLLCAEAESRRGRSSSWIRWPPRCWRKCSRNSWPVSGSSNRTCDVFHCT